MTENPNNVNGINSSGTQSAVPTIVTHVDDNPLVIFLAIHLFIVQGIGFGYYVYMNYIKH
jgi:hypothetical protein